MPKKITSFEEIKNEIIRRELLIDEINIDERIFDKYTLKYENNIKKFTTTKKIFK